jgi:hypothetical protein
MRRNTERKSWRTPRGLAHTLREWITHLKEKKKGHKREEKAAETKGKKQNDCQATMYSHI